MHCRNSPAPVQVRTRSQAHTMTAYHFSCTDRFEENLKILLKFVFTPYFTDENVEKERGIINQEIRMVEDTQLGGVRWRV